MADTSKRVFSEAVAETIARRKSVRTQASMPAAEEIRQIIAGFAANAQGPFNVPVRLDNGEEPGGLTFPCSPCMMSLINPFKFSSRCYCHSVEPRSKI